MLARGSRIARYEIEERLGEGAYGAVYRARDPVLGRTVAIKVIRAEAIAANEVNRTRFVREGRAVAALSHPNIVSVFDAGEADGVAFIVMEYVKGRPLRAFVGDLRVSTRTRMKWLTDVARALAFSHRAGLVHRDIKPENVLIADEGTVKVVDFGIARHTEDELESTQLTREGQMVGTPLYMAPEQMFGEPADARCDQFSWGVMAFELFSGGLPWSPKGGVLTFVESVHRQPPRELVALGGDVPRDVASVIERAIARDAAQRHPSMDAVVAALTTRPSASSLPMPVGMQPAPISSPSYPVPPPSGPPYPDPPSGPGSFPSSVGSARVPSRARPSSNVPGWAFAVGAAFIALALVASLVIVVVRARRSAAATSQAATAASAPSMGSVGAGMPITGAPAPRGKPEAVARYQAALLALRQANWHDATLSLKSAIDLDPALGAAHVRIAYLSMESPSDEDVARSYRAALALRDKLDDRDVVLLDALKPLFSEPPDLSGFAHGLAAAAERSPHDAEMQLYASIAEEMVGEIDAAATLVDRALAADGDYADAWQIRARLYVVKDEPAEARKAIDSCIRVAPSSTDCRLQLTWFDESSGLCADAEDAFKQVLALQPNEPSLPLAGVLRALERPRDAVEAATRTGIERLTPDVRPFRAPYALSALHISYGELDQALRDLDEAEERIRDSRDGDYHAQLETRRALLLFEMGSDVKAKQVLRSYLDARSAWSTPRIDQDPLVFGLLGGDVKAAIARKDAAPLPMRRFYWAMGAQDAANDPVSARRALEERPEVSALAAFGSHRFPAAAYEGRLLLVAGRAKEAIPLLESTARHCSVFEAPTVSTQAALWLGEARQATGDEHGACEAYATVIERWGHARPRSVTAEQARKRAASLHCLPR